MATTDTTLDPDRLIHQGADILDGRRVWSRYYLNPIAAERSAAQYGGWVVETTPGRIWAVRTPEEG